jgi:hypothetical protein
LLRKGRERERGREREGEETLFYSGDAALYRTRIDIPPLLSLFHLFFLFSSLSSQVLSSIAANVTRQICCTQVFAEKMEIHCLPLLIRLCAIFMPEQVSSVLKICISSKQAALERERKRSL